MTARSTWVDGCSWTFDGWTEKLAASQVAGLNLTVAAAHDDFASTIERIQHVVARIHADPHHLRLARGVSDIHAAGAVGGVGVVLNFQNAAPIGTQLDRLHLFHELGVRSVQLTYNERNAVGDGCLEPTDAGLSRFGRALIHEMNALGMVVDLSHVGRRTSMEALGLSERPAVFSHANPKALIDNPRNIDDDQIRACAAGGGVIGICGWGPILWNGSDGPPCVDDFVRCVEYVTELVGVDAVGVATDSTSSMRDGHIREHAQEVNAAYPEVTERFVARFGGGPEHRYPVPVASLRSLADALRRSGWPEEDVAKVMGENFLRVWSANWASGPAGSEATPQDASAGGSSGNGAPERLPADGDAGRRTGVTR